MTRTAQFLLLSATVARYCQAWHLQNGECTDISKCCALTAAKPTKPRYLKFCQDYNGDEACCIPGHDLENQVQFENLIDGLGPGCKNPMMYPNIRYFYCLGCDPKQPDYTSNSTPAGSTAQGIVTVCKSFIEKLWDDYAVQYRECGVMKPNECPPGFDDFDPYTCGDDLIIPPHEYSSGIEFMNAFKPPGMDDWDFVAQTDDEPCWEPKFMRSSAARLSSSATVGVMLLGAALRRFL